MQTVAAYKLKAESFHARVQAVTTGISAAVRVLGRAARIHALNEFCLTFSSFIAVYVAKLLFL